MKLELRLDRKIEVADFFTAKGLPGDVFQMVECKEHMTPIMILHVNTGKVIARSAAPDLAFRETKIERSKCTLQGRVWGF